MQSIQVSEFINMLSLAINKVIGMHNILFRCDENFKTITMNINDNKSFGYIEKFAYSVVVKTSIFETGFGMSPQQVEEFYAKHSALYPVGRVGEVSDTSVAIEFLISDKASFITGFFLIDCIEILLHEYVMFFLFSDCFDFSMQDSFCR